MPDPDPVLHDYLRSAVAAELTTLPTYLYTYWTIRPRDDGGSATGGVARSVIMSVALEEMLHMGLASNLLNALGGEADFTTVPYVPEFPGKLLRSTHHHPEAWGPDVALLPLSNQALKIFTAIELPAYDDPGGPTLKEFYDEYVLANLPADDGAYGHGNQLAPWDNPGAGELISISSKKDAEWAVKEILDQGEGLTRDDHHDDDHELAHYWKFVEVQDWLRHGNLDPHTDAYPVVGNPGSHLDRYTDEQKEANDRFNATYSALLDALQASLRAGSPDVYPVATGLMDQLGQQAAVLRNRGIVPGTASMAGPTFEYVAAGDRIGN